MARWTGTTKQRGLGQSHVKDKERLLAQHRDGDLCWRCGQPMYKSQALDRDHVIDRAKGGTSGPAVLAHASCNRSKGARAGNQAKPRLVLAVGRDTMCRQCGKPYHYAPRSCEICGKHYHPNHNAQRSCGRTCGAEIARRNRVAKGWMPKALRPKPPPRQRKPGPVASGQREPANGWPASRLQHWTCRYCGQIGVQKRTGEQRKVCGARACDLLRLRANNWRVRYGLTQDEADAAVLTSIRPAPSRLHVCAACGSAAPDIFRWCADCLCTSANAKGRRCGNRASTDGQCDYHASTGEVAAAS